MESLSNFIIFRAVCKNWRLAIDLTDTPVQLPWLIWPTATTTMPIDQSQQVRDNEYFVYSLSSNTTQRIPLPVNNVLVGTTAGFLLVFEYLCSFYFLNPLTGTKVTLPFLNPSLSYHIACLGHVTNHNSSFVGSEIYLILVQNLVFPTETMKYQFVRFQPPETIKHISIVLPEPSAFAYYKGRLFWSLAIPRVTCVYDASTGTKTSIEIPHPGEEVNFNFLINGMGDLLGVMMSYIDVVGLGEVSWKYQFEVYRLEHTDDFGCYRWSKLNEIGDRIIFLQDFNYGFCLRASDIRGLKGNYIYYKKEYWYRDYHYPNAHFCRYDMEDGTTEEVVMKSPDAIWFVPSLC
ncbi:F-box protein At2g05970-like [Carex rostrata]